MTDLTIEKDFPWGMRYDRTRLYYRGPLERLVMITNPAMVEAFEAALVRREAPNFLRNLRLVDGLYQEARALGVFPLSDPLDGIEVDLRLAQALNVRTTA